MKTLALAFTLLAFTGPAWAHLQGDENHLSASLELYMKQGSLVSLESVQDEIKQNGVKLLIKSADDENLDLPQAKVRVARGGACSITCTFPNGRIKIIEVKPNMSGEVVDAIRKAYEGMGASVNVIR